MEQLQTFKFNSNEVRTVIKNGEPWFVAKDVTDVLEIKNTTDAVKRLEDDEVTRFNLGGLSGEVNIVNESGLYSLIMASRKLEAKQFKRWVTGEVLPSIRKHGTYMTEDVLEKSIQDPTWMIGLLTNLKEEQNKRKVLEYQIKVDKPKVDFFEQVTSSKDAIDMATCAKVLNIPGYGRNNLFEFLRNKNILQQNNIPYQKYCDRGYFRVIENKFNLPDGSIKISIKTVVYQSGIDFIRRMITKEIEA